MKLKKAIEKWYLNFVSKLTGCEYGVDENDKDEPVHANLHVCDQELGIIMKQKEQEAYYKAAHSLTEIYKKYRERLPDAPESQLLALIALKEKIANQR